MALQTQLETNHAFGEIIGKSKKMQHLFTRIQTAATGDITVLIQGETGTGKELLAKSIHDNSPRKVRPLVAVNCAAIPEGLIESELFGNERGAFTGATERRIGKFEQANTGTLFLDEIGNMPPILQAKLLRVLEEREFQRQEFLKANYVKIMDEVYVAGKHLTEDELLDQPIRFHTFVPGIYTVKTREENVDVFIDGKPCGEDTFLSPGNHTLTFEGDLDEVTLTLLLPK